MDNKEYEKLVKKASPNSPILKNLLIAFLIGGGICVIGEAFRQLYGETLSLSKEDAGTATSVTMVFLGAFFTAIGVYDKLAKYGGAGTLLPITGFANAVTSPAMEFHAEGIVTGICAKIFVIAGPVIVFSLLSGVVYGIILCILK